MNKTWDLGFIPTLDEEDVPLLIQFCKESSLHGLKFIGQRGKRLIERIFWGTAFCIAVIVAVMSIRQVWKKYSDTPIITVFKPVATPTRLISFPAITICNSNNILREKVEELIKKSHEPDPDESTLHKLFMVEQICSATKTVAEQYSSKGITGKLPKETREKVLKYQETHGFLKHNQSIPDFLLEVTDDCSEMTILCSWNGEKQNCNNIFQSVVSDYGRCCSFNMIPSSLLLHSNNKSEFTTTFQKEEQEEGWAELEINSDSLVLPDIYAKEGQRLPPKFPRRQKRPGKASGFTVVLNPKLSSYYCTNLDSAGFMVLPHSPLQFPRMTGGPMAVFPGFESFLQLQADVTLASYEISGFKPQDRNCYFGSEFSLQFYNFYTMANCEDECIVNLTYTECSCVHHFMPRNHTMDVCGPASLKCIENVAKDNLVEKVSRLGTRAMCNKCLPTCTAVHFQSSISYMPIRKDVDIWVFPNGTHAPWAKKNISILNVYFSGDSSYPKLRTKLYGPIELISSTGGLLSLCLGFSILSLLEIIYFLTFRTYFCVHAVFKKTGEIAQVVLEVMKRNGLSLNNKIRK